MFELHQGKATGPLQSGAFRNWESFGDTARITTEHYYRSDYLWDSNGAVLFLGSHIYSYTLLLKAMSVQSHDFYTSG
ncbi:MAG: hypothetical protein EOP04_24985 [Proteobacteria bacterium]|nr:MAG: hypothetical protein EOP04_24985 [Pseudomonadota bacterium]